MRRDGTTPDNKRVDLRRVRLSDQNKGLWEDALGGSWGQYADSKMSVVLVKNMMLINVFRGSDVDVVLPSCRDSFLMTSRGRRIDIIDSKLVCKMGEDETGFAQVPLQKWN